MFLGKELCSPIKDGSHAPKYFATPCLTEGDQIRHSYPSGEETYFTVEADPQLKRARQQQVGDPSFWDPIIHQRAIWRNQILLDDHVLPARLVKINSHSLSFFSITYCFQCTYFMDVHCII